MSYRVAIASSDGKVVNQHFGHAEEFLIVQVEDTQYEYIEKRSPGAACQLGSHDDVTMEQVIESLSDCKYVLCTKIGPGAEQKLRHRGIIPLEISHFIDEAMQNLITYTQRAKE
ncbi:MAG: Dinitrogenase iron-molybdenum cofactor biosynthesis protein [Oscillospiraceae bacterium]|nr:Dinitrogenase iron-molybdenum cofactor biosynthesis protein [Oscillospiraceae bacterium]